jgi:hypothetical protein
LCLICPFSCVVRISSIKIVFIISMSWILFSVTERTTCWGGRGDDGCSCSFSTSHSVPGLSICGLRAVLDVAIKNQTGLAVL